MVLAKHAPIRAKKIKGNLVSYMPKELSKAIVNRSKLRSGYTK